MITSRPSKVGTGIVAVAILLLMLSSMIGNADSSKPVAQQPVSQSPAPTAPVTPPGTSPGQIAYTNTWSRTGQEPVCVISDAVVQASLKPESQSWTLTSSVPSLLAGSSALSGQSIVYTYTAYSNGSFIASDGQGNDLSWKVVTGFPAGTTTVKLYGNSTEALQVYSVGPASHLSANFTVVYHLVQTSGCEPHGVQVTLQGWIDWPSSSGGTLHILFRGEQLSSNSTQVTFGGHDGQQLVFNWSDSMKQTPATYQGQTGMVSWSVGPTFKIDPSIIGTSSSQQAINWGDQRKLWHTVESNGTIEYWAFYFDGSNIEKAWSATGITWHSSVLTSGAGATSGSAFSTWMVSEGGVYTLYYVLADPSAGSFILGTATLGDNGAVSNLVQTQLGTIWGAGDSFPCVYGSSTDLIVGVTTSKSGAYQLEVYNISPSSKQVLSKFAISTGTQSDGCIALGLTSGYALIYGAATTGGPITIITSANGNSWSSPTTAPVTAPITMSSAVAIGNAVHFATVASSGEQYLNCVYPCSTTSPVLTLASDSAGVVYDNIVLSTNARALGASVTATYHNSLGQVWSRTSDDDGQSWTPAQEIDGGSTGIIASGSLQADYDYVESADIVATADVAWVTGTSAPYAIWFPAYPVVVPSAASTQNPWAKSGYSPYESYYSQLDEYVSPGNGLLGVSQTDLSIPGRTPALSVTRVYSQPSDFVGASANANVPYGYDNYTLSDLGIGWELSYPWIGSGASGTIYFHPGNGAAIPTAFNSSNIMEYHGAIDFVLYKNSNNTYTLYTADGTKYVYAGLKLSTITSPDSPFDKLTFSYNVSPGYITQIQDGEGRTVSFSYNANNTLASITSGSQTWRYTYHGSDLSSVTDPLGRVTRYYYVLSNPWLISEIAYPTGAATYYGYDTGLVAPYVTTDAVASQYEYNSGSLHVLARSNNYLFNMVDGSVVSSQVTYLNATSAQQGSTVFDFRAVDGKYVELEYQKDQSGTLIGSVETDFDQQGRENQTILFSAQGAKLAYSVTHYDEWGNVNFTRDYDGHDTYFAYAGTTDQYQFGNAKTGLIKGFYTNSTIDGHIHTDLLGSAEYQDTANSNTPIEAFYLYSNNEVLKVSQLYVTPSAATTTWLTTSYTYDALANLQTMTDPLHHQTCYSYSPLYEGAYLTSETSSGSSNCYTAPDVTAGFTYNFATGDLTSKTDGKGNTTSYTYDAVGRLTSESYPAVNGVIAKTSYSYNDASNTVTATDPSGNITKSYYDGLGRLTQQQTYLSPSSPYSSEYYTYNWLNEVLTDQAPNGATTSYTYDSLGRQIGVTNPDGTHESSAYNYTTNTQTITDGNGHKTQNVYDFMQNLIAVSEYWTGGYNATTYTYDGVGNLLMEVGPNGNQVTQYSYDDLNRLVETTYPDGTTQKASYDSVGDLVNSTDQEGRVTTYSYDYMYQLSAINYPDGSSTTYTYDRNGNELTVTNPTDQVKYSYDALDRMTSETDTIGGTQYTISYAYNLAGNVQSITYPDHTTVTNSYDALGRIMKVAGGSTTYASFTYNPDDTVSTMTYGNGEVTTYAYDSMDRPTSITTSQGSTQELSLSYKYNAAGDVVSINSESFGYDALDRLTSATGPWGTTTYSYDAAGNMVQKQQNSSSSSATKYTYNSMDELVRSSTAAGATTYSYDGDGNLVIKNDGTNVWTYIYNAEGEMTKVLQNGAIVQQNYYDGEGRRIEQTTGAATILYLYAGLSVLFEKNLQTGVATKHVYANGMQVASITTSGTLFLSQDELGSTRLVTSGTSPVFSSDYMPYGIQYGATGSEEFMYASMLYDAVTGLYYDNARFYDPSTGRFLTEDPIGGVQSDPQSLNQYAYARDNPLAITDPSGLSWDPRSWTPATWLLLGAVIGLTIVDAAQFGIDPVTDALDAGTIANLAASLATTVAIGGVLNLATNTALSGGQIGGWSQVGFSFGFAALGIIGEGEEGSWTKGMSTTGIGIVGESIFGTILSEKNIEFEYHPQWDLPSGESFEADFAIGRTADSNGLGIDVKTSSVTWNYETKFQFNQYMQVFGRGNWGYVFVDIAPEKVPQDLMNKILENNLFYAFI